MRAPQVASLLAVAATLAGGCFDDDAATSTTATISSGDAEAILQRTLSPHPEVESGEIVLDATVRVRQDAGAAGGLLRVALDGPFESPDGEVPRFALDATATLTNLDAAAGEESAPFVGSLTSTGDAGYLGYEADRFFSGDYELDPSLYSLLGEVLLAIPDGGSLLVDPVEQGTVEIGGTPTAHVGADLNVDAAAAALNELLAGSGDLGLGIDPVASLPPSTVTALASLVDSGRVDLYSDPETGLLRRLVVSVDVSGVSVEQVNLELDAQTSQLNAPQEIEAPEDPEPLARLLQKYMRLLGALG